MDHVKMVMETIAHFHGAMWQVLNCPEGTFVGGLSKREVHNYYGIKHPKFILNSFLSKQKKSIIKLLENRNNSPLAAKVKRHSLNGPLSSMLSSDSKILTITHGDLWSNNMMFAHDDEGKPTKMKLLDYQMSSIGHPAVDLCYFFYITTDRAFRRMHLIQCLRWYFETLSSNYLAHSLRHFSFNDFLKEFADYREVFSWLGLAVSKYYLCICWDTR